MAALAEEGPGCSCGIRGGPSCPPSRCQFRNQEPQRHFPPGGTDKAHSWGAAGMTGGQVSPPAPGPLPVSALRCPVPTPWWTGAPGLCPAAGSGPSLPVRRQSGRDGCWPHLPTRPRVASAPAPPMVIACHWPDAAAPSCLERVAGQRLGSVRAKRPRVLMEAHRVHIPNKASFLSLGSSPRWDQGQSWCRLDAAVSVLRTVPRAGHGGGAPAAPGKGGNGTGRPRGAHCTPCRLPKSRVGAGRCGSHGLGSGAAPGMGSILLVPLARYSGR